MPLATAPWPIAGALLVRIPATLDTPVDNEHTWLVVVDATPYSWLPFTASVDVAVTSPAATFVIFCATPPRLASYAPSPEFHCSASRCSVDTPVDSEAIELFAVLRPVDRDATELFVAPRPVDREPT